MLFTLTVSRRNANPYSQGDDIARRALLRIHDVPNPTKSDRDDKDGKNMPRLAFAISFLVVIAFCGCQDWLPHDTQSLLIARFQRSEIVGFLAGLGTTFAAMPDLLTMLRRRSASGMNPRIPAIMGIFQVLWVYYGFLILSRPVIAWNVIAVMINFCALVHIAI